MPRSTASSSPTSAGRDLLGVAGGDGRQQHVQARLVAGQQRRGAGDVQVAGHRQRVGDGARRVELHADRHVAEREVEVDDAHPLAGLPASATARLVASVVLPQPPLAENTVTIWPGAGSSSAAAAASIRRDTS